jgi:hypothetical protein
VKIVRVLSFLLVACAVSACHHEIEFQDVQYTVPSTAKSDGIVVVIDQATLNRVDDIHSFMTGIAHSWDARPGVMMKQIADIEFPQMFGNYHTATSYTEPQTGNQRVTLMLSLLNYDFSNFHSSISMHAVAYGPGRSELLDKTYSGEGDTQGAKMFWGGAFAMKSAIRQSSIDVYKQMFASLRGDLGNLLAQHKATPENLTLVPAAPDAAGM